MPKSCVVYGCSNHNWKYDKKRSYFEFPKRIRSPYRRDKWLAAIGRKNENGSRWSPPHSRVVCSDHFITGKPVKDELHPDYAPSILPHRPCDKTPAQHLAAFRRYSGLYRKRTLDNRKKPCVQRLPFTDVTNRVRGEEVTEDLQPESVEESPSNILTDNPISISPEQTEVPTQVTSNNTSENVTDHSDRVRQEVELFEKQLNEANSKIEELEKRLEEKSFSSKLIEGDDKKSRIMTGLPYTVFVKTFDYLVRFVQGKKKNSLPYVEQFFLTLVRLRQNTSFEMLAYQTGVALSTIIDCFWRWTDIMYWKLGFMVCWPDRESMIEVLPDVFHQIYPRLTAIIDCFEIFIGNPGPLKAKQQTYSNYKKHTTAKVLIACNPLGAITFLSVAWGGRVSDVELVRKSGFISSDLHLPGDQILADRGFTLQDDFATVCSAELIIPAFTRGKKQLSSQEVESARNLSSIRIHVERVIGLLKNRYTILQGTLPTKMVKSLKDEADQHDISSIDRLVHVCASLVNLGDSIVFKKS